MQQETVKTETFTQISSAEKCSSEQFNQNSANFYDSLECSNGRRRKS